jgi:hypothetical protein
MSFTQLAVVHRDLYGGDNNLEVDFWPGTPGALGSQIGTTQSMATSNTLVTHTVSVPAGTRTIRFTGIAVPEVFYAIRLT